MTKAWKCLADEGLKDAEIIKRVGVSRATVSRIQQRYRDEGVGAVAERARPGRPNTFDEETRVNTALACNDAQGRGRWDLRLLADKAVELGFVENILACQCQRDTEKTGNG